MPPSSRKLKGVIISCEGDIQFLGAQKFIPYEVSASGPILTAPISSLSAMSGVAVRVYQFATDFAWSHRGIVGTYQNKEAAALFPDLDARRSEDFFTLDYLLAPKGSALVIRADGQDITPQQVEVLCYYCCEQTMYMFTYSADYLEPTRSNEERAKIAALFNPDDFRRCFAWYKEKRILGDPSCPSVVGDPSWATAVSPV